MIQNFLQFSNPMFQTQQSVYIHACLIDTRKQLKIDIRKRNRTRYFFLLCQRSISRSKCQHFEYNCLKCFLTQEVYTSSLYYNPMSKSVSGQGSLYVISADIQIYADSGFKLSGVASGYKLFVWVINDLQKLSLADINY